MMKKTLILVIGLLLNAQMIFGQTSTTIEQRPFIKVIGHAEKKIVPDEIYLSISINERVTGRDKITVEEQVENLKQALVEIDVPLELLSVADVKSRYKRVRWTKYDVLMRSEFQLKLSTVKQVEDVFKKLDELNIDRAYIEKVSHSRMEEFRQEVEIEAIKNAKSKADYLLEAIGQETGTALVIAQLNPISSDDNYYSYDKKNRGVSGFMDIEDDMMDKGDFSGTIGFREITLETSIYVIFEIKE